ncbi:hypothetical protein FOPG_02437 [Fusarium oxysporum f. sp. conglutinans race 2 54008]|uniref:DUF6594 domain-containing protein n=2 Tax=Fusarium oxysporum f. sp. conglutinans TaxID=100902 RepID=F9FSQ0_FUSOF|nr:hypothetical protein FOXB_09431 [Fusarium oxysporum f. sp. conglutinans Fo5176]EXL85618.1 hypothetical protein FOPG_02437 [Fusarium oxysporum f. sp. conglutinans race 2 54008]KAG6987978.1 hypothetical protein FocnCong_v003375 [Fusarium oxysporum f. sp. conglutinans]KAI8413821.1 hypothetical protein FOFC_07106 [Fusarium oxysporum]
MGCFGADNDTNRVDEETAVRGVQVDFSDDRWIVDLELDNIISNISENESWTTSFRRGFQGANDNEQPQNELGKSYRINFAVLQRIQLKQLRTKLAKHAVSLRCEAGEPQGWQDTLKDYIQALQNYEYMERRSLQPEDPFYMSGEKYQDRKLLETIIGGEAYRFEGKKVFPAIGDWQKGPDGSRSVRDTRQDNYQRNWKVGFHQRLAVAAVGGIFLMAPMWLMVLHNTLYTALVSTTVFVAVFGSMAARYLTSLMDVMSSTAAYAAVLVVFVGLITEMHDG